MAVRYLKVISDPLKFYAAYGDKNENSVLRAKAAATQTKGGSPCTVRSK